MENIAVSPGLPAARDYVGDYETQGCSTQHKRDRPNLLLSSVEPARRFGDFRLATLNNLSRKHPSQIVVNLRLIKRIAGLLSGCPALY